MINSDSAKFLLSSTYVDRDDLGMKINCQTATVF